MPRREYKSSLDFIDAGFQACLQNAHDLVAGSQALITAALHAPALSIAVLALEELGKLHTIDGLLFARSDDHKASAFKKSGRSHDTKLEAFLMFPMFLRNLAPRDPRYGTEKRFDQALAISLHDLKEAGNRVLDRLPTKSLTELDVTKQRGFYVEVINDTFRGPRDVVDPELAKSVCHLAWRAVTTLDFLLKGDGLRRYLDWAQVNAG